MAVHPEVRQLYRSFLRLHASWPPQPSRPARLQSYILTRVRNEFRQPTESLAERVKYGQEQLASLQRILNNEIEKKYPIPETSPIPAFLPPKKTYTLLDQEAQDTLEEKTTVSYFKDYLASKFERQ
ncbi:uncharacterized protein SPPG_04830 [Spizellomyces punctatus DAOM BR117]|uniref:Mitochondrial protein n=1 Tax=Spizellomyces punctatus (strain DAOM BR117) TaxID=645134 RepID=A0A0L0HI28_SPIPD|nr:uncharacterized protein SPPG_04830 [Spizellomyces punctatus DAOM BR117]KND00520.1 hypothetical protein SPPG_04830 [Spizellomyces punctatus DAOM BR117]|eukprot:XP_016608559.1 hypothetical protein SPPG_04830 [Spizellomyces punctatus DAOM BR117]